MKRIAIYASYLQRNRWAVLIFSCLGLGVAGIFMHNAGHGDNEKLAWEILGNSLMLAGACFFAGALIGFLFGIPRTVQGTNSPDEEVDYRINTNLEQISDWLTKIIVGLTLVNLGQIPEMFDKWVVRIAPGLDSGSVSNSAVDGVFAGGVMVYFLVLGFLSGYIITRTQISSLFSRADANLLFNRRDTDLLGSIAEMFETGLPNMNKEELRERITKSSLLTQNSIFAYAKNCRKIFHKRRQPENISLTVPVFSALVESDYEGLNHQYRGQLGYALKDQHLGKKKPWDEATEKAMIPDLERAVEVFEQAILIRGDWKSKGYGVYELNLAITKLELLRLWGKYGLSPLGEGELKIEKERIKECFEVALNSGEAYEDTIRRSYSSWYDAQTRQIVMGNLSV